MIRELEPEAEAGERDGEPPRLNTKSTTAILASEEPPLAWIVPGYVGEGLTILAGRQKVGKTWLAIDWACAVASGGKAMGAIQCESGDVLYADLENGRRRVRSRIAVLHPEAARSDLSRLEWASEAPPPGKGLVEALDEWRSSVENPRLVVIDAAETPAWKGSTGNCAGLAQLQRWATEHGVAVVWLHRMRKVNDPLVAIGGSGGVFGFADAVLLLDRNGDGGTLELRGRDGEDKHVALGFAAGGWTLGGDALECDTSRQRMDILDMLESCGEAVSPGEVAGALGRSTGSVRIMMFRMARAGELTRMSRGLYRHPKQTRKAAAESSDQMAERVLQELMRDRVPVAAVARTSPADAS